MKKRKLLILFGVVCLALMVVSLPFMAACAKPAPAPAPAPAPLPKMISFASYPVGTLFHAIATAYAKVLTEHSPIGVDVVPTKGERTATLMVNEGEADLANLGNIVFDMIYRGTEDYAGEPRSNLRVLWHDVSIDGLPIVRGDSDIHSVADLKGRRVGSDYPGTAAVRLWMEANLASAGLTWDDVKKVPVTDTPDCFRALIEGRVEVGIGSLGMPVVTEAQAKVGARVISAFIDAEALKRVAKVFPGPSGESWKAGRHPAVVEDVDVLKSPHFIFGSTHMSDDVAYELVKAVWGYPEEPGVALFFLKGMDPQRFVIPGTACPYHPGAIKFYKEKGVWTDEMEKRQKELLAK